MSFDFPHARELMVEQQIRPWDVLDIGVLDTMARVPREEFVPSGMRTLAYSDTALPLAHGESMLKPVIAGRALQALLPAAHESVLEIGTGSGYLTACLGRLAREVVSLERHADIADAARVRLARQGVSNATVVTADAFAWDEGRAFDAVCVTGAVDEVPPAFLRWLNPGGRMFIVRGRAPAMEAILLHRDVNGSRSQSLFETELPYLAGAAPVPMFAL